MKHFSLSLLMVLTSISISAQDLVLDFESFGLPLDTYLQGQDTNRYHEGCFEWQCSYDTSFGGYWASGMAVSTMRDDSTGNYTNLFGAKAGSGHESDAFGVLNGSQEVFVELNSSCEGFYGVVWMSAYMTNSTYAYESMSNGDQFAKQFGGPSGDDPDYYFIRFRFYDQLAGANDSIPTSHLDFYLADFRFEDNSMDYILDDWTLVQLNNYPAFEHSGYRVSMQVYSSDTGMFGINTPTFFNMDDLVFAYPGGIHNDADVNNPAIQVMPSSIDLKLNVPAAVRLYTLNGNLIYTSEVRQTVSIPTSSLPQGIYVLETETPSGAWSQKVFRW